MASRNGSCCKFMNSHFTPRISVFALPYIASEGILIMTFSSCIRRRRRNGGLRPCYWREEPRLSAEAVLYLSPRMHT